MLKLYFMYVINMNVCRGQREKKRVLTRKECYSVVRAVVVVVGSYQGSFRSRSLGIEWEINSKETLPSVKPLLRSILSDKSHQDDRNRGISNFKSREKLHSRYADWGLLKVANFLKRWVGFPLLDLPFYQNLTFLGEYQQTRVMKRKCRNENRISG